ncbi:MAG: hypothetical protein ACE5DY_01250 [Mariprofundaceae bacterium]
MKKTLSPEAILSELENQECDRLQNLLVSLTAKKNLLNNQLSLLKSRLEDITNQRLQYYSHSVKAEKLASLEAERQEEVLRQKKLLTEMEHLLAEEKKLKADLFNCMNKSKAYLKLKNKEIVFTERQASRLEQQSTDDMMANRASRRL